MEDCPYCKALEDKKNVLYEDEKFIAIVPERPITRGHIQVIPKKHHESFQDMEDKDVEHMFYTASFSATALFENLEAHGTNIIMNTGGQLKKGGHVHVDVIARKTDDSLNFLWTPKKMSEDEMNGILGKIKDKTAMIGLKKKGKEVLDLDKKEVEKIESKPAPEKKDSQEKTEKTDSEQEKPPEQKQEKAPEEKAAGREETPSDNKIRSREPETPTPPSEEEQRYKSKNEQTRDIKEDDENYMVKQLRRMP